jgi:hypothetical protein
MLTSLTNGNSKSQIAVGISAKSVSQYYKSCDAIRQFLLALEMIGGSVILEIKRTSNHIFIILEFDPCPNFQYFKMAKTLKKTKNRSSSRSAFTIIEQATENKNLKESLGENASLYFEDKQPQAISKSSKAPRVLKVDEILSSKNKITVPTSHYRKKSAKENAETKLSKRYSKSKKPLKPVKTVGDIWGMDPKRATKKKSILELDTLAPTAMSYRPDPVNQLRILQAVEMKEQIKLEKTEKFKQDVEKIRNAVALDDFESFQTEEPLTESKEDNDNISLISECETESLPAPVLTKPKTRKQRASEEKQKEILQKSMDKRQEKDFDKQFDQLSAIAKQVRRELNMPSKKAIIRKPTEISTDDVILPEQVSSSLREMTTSGNLLGDVFKGLKKRMAIEGIKRKGNTLHTKLFTRNCFK